ncbi:MAG: c-type cytochrome [Burkholderiaceae bacterium]|nr:c-type cytochrome [Burkholderiaceae bacterium]
MRLQPFVRHPERSIPELENSTACEPASRAGATAGCRLARLAARLLQLGRLRAAWLVASLMISASAQAAEPVAAKAGAPAAVRADLLYHNYCSVCHGDRGDGRSRARGSLVPPPRDFTSPQSLGELTRDRMIAATAAGKPGTAMVGWSTQLGPREIEAVVDYVIDTFMKPRTLASFETGRALYARSCASCHGADGQGGPAGVGPTGASVSAARNFTAPRARTDLTRESAWCPPSLTTAARFGRWPVSPPRYRPPRSARWSTSCGPPSWAPVRPTPAAPRPTAGDRTCMRRCRGWHPWPQRPRAPRRPAACPHRPPSRPT